MPRFPTDAPSTDAFAPKPEALGEDPLPPPDAVAREQMHELVAVLQNVSGVPHQDLDRAFDDLPPAALELFSKLARGGG
jgi:hypothetical protein